MASALGAILLIRRCCSTTSLISSSGSSGSSWDENDPATTYASPLERAWYYLHRLICGAVLLFLISPILAIIPLSFNSVPFFTYPMSGLALRLYEEFFLNDRSQGALHSSIFVAISVTVLSTLLGTLAALGLSRPNFPCGWRLWPS